MYFKQLNLLINQIIIKCFDVFSVVPIADRTPLYYMYEDDGGPLYLDPNYRQVDAPGVSNQRVEADPSLLRLLAAMYKIREDYSPLSQLSYSPGRSVERNFAALQTKVIAPSAEPSTIADNVPVAALYVTWEFA